VDVLLAGPAAAAARASLAARLNPADVHADEASRRLTVVARDGLATLLSVARLLRDDGIEVADIALRQPSLDEAFLALTAGTTMTGATAG
jgi:ABC-2 type transport system ATP-binding protein